MSLDVLRGLDMLYLVSSATFLVPALTALGASKETQMFLCGHPWEGFTAYDIIMPLFIFMCGAAMPFALGKRMDAGRPTGAFWRHVLARFALLWVLGLVAQGRLLEFDIMTFSPFNNTLQTIAVGYLLTAAVMCVRSAGWRYAITAALPVAYAAFMACGADYGVDTNAAIVLERKILAPMCPAGSLALKTNGYTWFATVPMFGFMALCGFHATNVIRSGLGAGRKVGALAVAGVSLWILGRIALACGVPSIKHVFTVSFTLQAMGWCVLLLDAAYLALDVLSLKRGWGLVLLFGQTSLAAYMLGDIFTDIPRHAATVFSTGALRQAGANAQAIAVGVLAFALIAFALYVWRGFKSRSR